MRGNVQVRSSVKMLRIFGIDIGFHYTWLIAAFLITWSLAAGYFPQVNPGGSPAQNWGLGLTASLLLFASVIMHELGHSLIAISRNLPVKSITLFIFGGAAHLEREVERPTDEVAITVAGPAVSLALAALFHLMTFVVQGSDTTVALFTWVRMVNLYLGLFNLLPGLPLDGGRLLRAFLWWRWGSFVRATHVASLVGRGIAYLFIGGGFFMFLTGIPGNGIWLVFLGWFLASSADSAYQSANLESMLRNVPVHTLASRAVVVDPAATIRQLVDDYVLGQNSRAVLVMRAEELLGIITLTDVKRAPRESWELERVAEWMTPVPLKTIQTMEDVSKLLRLMSADDLNSVPVMEGNRVMGMVGRPEVIRYLQTRQELGR